MKKRPVRFLVSILLILSMATGTFAANPSDMTDIDTHWARDAIYYGMQRGLFGGVSATEFGPDQEMSRGMFITVLGRLAGVNPEEYRQWYLPYLYTDVKATDYYAPYVCWGTRLGIVSGKGEGKFAPGDPITREQMAAMVGRYVSICNYQLVSGGTSASPAFSDAEEIAAYARDSVENLRLTGIMGGSVGLDGTYYFYPRSFASRGQCAAIISRLTKCMRPYEGREIVSPNGLSLTPNEMELYLGDTAVLSAAVSPANATNKTVTWFSQNPEVAVVLNGKVTALAEGVAQVYAVTCNGLTRSCKVVVTEEPEPEEPDPTTATSNESYSEKCMRIFGEVVADYKGYYVGKGSDHVVAITVPVWQFTDSTHTQKTTRTITLWVHRNIASTVSAIFGEIYRGEEQFPIYSAGGFRANEHSEHGIGVAIDINPTENCEMEYNADGVLTPTVGTHWTPGEDDYSIPADGDVVRAFKKYGFGWGGDWRSKKDYMHFSYFAT